jgi:hypothetical protein
VRSRWRTALLLVVTSSAAAAPAASASPVPIAGMRAQFDMKFRPGQWLRRVGEDCISIADVGWGGAGSRKEFARGITHWIEPETQATGTYDGVAHAGAAHDSLTGFEFSRSVKPFTTLEMQNIGIEVSGGHAYVSATFAKGKPLFSVAKRVRIAMIANPKLIAGPATEQGHPDRQIPNSFLYAVQGKATILPGLRAVVQRFGCTRPVGVLRPRPLRVGAPFGFVTFQLQPTGATGLAGTADMTDLELDNDEFADVAIAPVAPATSGRAGAVRFEVAAGNTAPLSCSFGTSCVPAAGAKLGMAGGFTVSYNGKAVTVDGLEATYQAPVPPSTAGGVAFTASVDGQRMPIATPTQSAGRASAEFLAALSSALGLHFTGGSLGLTPTFTTLGPL